MANAAIPFTIADAHRHYLVPAHRSHFEEVRQSSGVGMLQL
jgi:hypothetical protein